MRWTSNIRFVFLLPAVVWVLAFTVFPLGYSLYLAFFKIESKVEVVREKVPVLDEQGEPVLLSSGKPRTRNIVHKNTVTTSEFVGLFNFERLLGDPQVATAIRVTAIFVLVAVPMELALGFLGIPFLSNPEWALFSVILVDVWQWTPFCFLVFLAALQGLPDELFEAARIDGASSLDLLTRVILPLLQPTILIVLLLRL